MPFIELLFNAIAIFYAFRAIQLLREVWSTRATLRQPPLTRKQKQIAEGIAFYVAIPPGVFIHELGHALFVLAFGGEILRFRVYGYWGFVEHIGSYTAFESWFIALAGTLGSLLYSAALWAWASRQEAPFYRYAGLRSVRFHIYFTLIYYPLFTLATQFGDWRTIYDFGTVPGPAAVTLVAHALLLGGFYWLDRRGGFVMPHFKTAAEAAQFTALRDRAAAQPGDAALQLAYAEQLINRGLAGQAEPLLPRAAENQSGSAELYLLLARAEMDGSGRPGRKAIANLEKALALGLRNPEQQIAVRRTLAEHAFEKGKAAEAMAYLDRCIDEVRARPEISPALARACHQTRGVVRRQTGRYAEAEEDLRQALHFAQLEGNSAVVSSLEQELAVLDNHRQQRQRL